MFIQESGFAEQGKKNKRKTIRVKNCINKRQGLRSKEKNYYTVKPRFTAVFGGKETSAVNRGFVWFTLCTFSPIWGKGNGRGISGFAVHRGTVNRGFTVVTL